MYIQIKRDKAEAYPSLGEEQNLLIQVKSDARQRKILYHYTNIEGLFSILKYRQIKFNRIDYMNDLREKKYFGYNSDYIYAYFVSCFNHESTESIPLWHMYTNSSYGVRIGLKSDKENPFVSAVDLSQIRCVRQKNGESVLIPKSFFPSIRIADIIYLENDKAPDNFFVDHPTLGKVLLDDAVAGIKNSNWMYEKETRMVISLTPYKPVDELPLFTHLFVPFDFSLFFEIEVMFSPFMSAEVKEATELMCEKIKRELSISINCQNSCFDDEIYRK